MANTRKAHPQPQPNPAITEVRPVTLTLTAAECEVVVTALNNVRVQGLEAMQMVLGLADKVRAAIPVATAQPALPPAAE